MGTFALLSIVAALIIGFGAGYATGKRNSNSNNARAGSRGYKSSRDRTTDNR